MGADLQSALASSAGPDRPAELASRVSVRRRLAAGSWSRRLVLLSVVAVVGLVPVVFDPSTPDAFDLPKLMVTAVGASVIGVVLLVAAALGTPLRWGGSLRWPALALVGTSGMATLTSTNPRLSLIGAFESRDGLVLAVSGAILAWGVMEAASERGLRAVLVALYGFGGGLTVLYGLLQLHDHLVGGTRWDPVPWGHLLFPNVFATFGNPNHLGGELAMLLPIGLALAMSAKTRAARAAIGIVGLLAVVELVDTASRGAWLAAVVAATVMAVLLGEEVRRHKGALALVVASVLTAATLFVAFGGPLVFGAKFHTLLHAGPDSSIGIRLEEWRIGLRLGVHHLALGTGPDTFSTVFHHYQTARFAHRFGPDALVSGPHDLFIDQLDGTGLLGLAALLWLLGACGCASLRQARRSRRAPELLRRVPGYRQQRLALAAVTASLAAYVVQASFDIQQVGLVVTFWVLVGLLGALTSERVPGDVRPAGMQGAIAWLLDRTV